MNVSGDTMTGELTVNTGTGTRIVLGSGIQLWANAAGGWARGFSAYNTSGTAALENGNICGAYGTANTLNYMYYGGTYNSPAMVINPSNKCVGIGTTSPSYKLHVVGDATTAGLVRIINNGNTITIGAQNSTWCHIYNSGDAGFIFNKKVCTTDEGSLGDTQYRWGGLYSTTGNFSGAVTVNSTIYAKTGMYSDGYVSAKGNNSSSDLRLKTILSLIRPSLKDFAKAPLFRFAWKSNPDMVEIGSSAQYWRNVLPDTVKERDGWLEMGYGNIALAGVITIARDFETLEQRVDRLEKENGKLKKRIKELERRAA